MKNIKFLFMLIVIGITVSCTDDFLDPELHTSKKADVAINTPEDLHNLVLAVYDRMNNTSYYGRTMLTVGDVRCDDVENSGATGRYVDLSEFSMAAKNGDAYDLWTTIYKCIALTNIVIDNTTVEEDDDVSFYKGQAKALRALFYFDLHRLFSQKYCTSGNLSVPIVLKHSDKLNKITKPKRNTIAEVEAQIEKDFKEGIKAMELASYDSKIEMNLIAAKMLLARFYLYTGNNSEVASLCSPYVNNIDYTGSQLYETMWTIKEHGESIFELAYTNTDYNGTNSYSYLYEDDGYGDFSFSDDALGLFAKGDIRFPYVNKNTEIKKLKKLPVMTGANINLRIIRYAEVALNYVEACVKTNSDLSSATTVLNALRSARGAAVSTTDLSKDDLDIVLTERRKELIGEGHRYFDLIRNGLDINAVTKGSIITYPNNLLALPIPEAETDANKNIIQNADY